MAKDSTLLAQPEFRDAKRDLSEVISQCGSVVLGKERRIRLALSCMLAGGHLLIEDIPGVGKTTLAHALACAAAPADRMLARKTRVNPFQGAAGGRLASLPLSLARLARCRSVASALSLGR